MTTVALSLLGGILGAALFLYLFVAWLEYDQDIRHYGTNRRAAVLFGLAWPRRAYIFWRAE